MVYAKIEKRAVDRSCCHAEETLDEMLNSYIQSREAPNAWTVANQDREMNRIRHHVLM